MIANSLRPFYYFLANLSYKISILLKEPNEW